MKEPHRVRTVITALLTVAFVVTGWIQTTTLAKEEEKMKPPTRSTRGAQLQTQKEAGGSIQQKFDQAASNQRQILKQTAQLLEELKIIKIRATSN